MTYTILDKARALLVMKYPFWATIVLNTEIRIGDNLHGQPNPTACTDGRVIVINQSFLDTLTVPKVVFLLAHEAGHIAMHHALRVGSRNRKVWNIACDYALNWLLKEDGLEFIESGLLDPEYSDSAEANYDKLLQAAKDGKLPQCGGIGEDLVDPQLTEAEAQELTQRAQALVAQAATMARLQGKLSAGLERLVGEILNPDLPWQDMLREYMVAVIQSDESWARRNRRYKTYMPGRFSTALDSVGVIVDTSGSISGEELNAMLSEVRAIAEMTCPASMRIMCADTAVVTDQVVEAGQPFEVEVKGGGGTDMREPLAKMAEHEPRVVILLTDGYTPWPDCEPDYPLIVCCTTDAPVPIGRVVRV